MRPMLKRHNIHFRERLAASKVIAVLRAEDTEYFPDVAQVLYDSGLRVVETALTTPGALHAVGQMQVELGRDTLVGAGNVRTVSDVDSCAAAGVDFLATPTVSPDVLARAQQYELPVVCGALTPTEVDAAWRHGAAVVRVFPIGPSGGVRYLQQVRGPLPEIPLVPAGGVTLPEVEGYLGAGAFAVAVGAPLLGDAVCGGRLEELGQRASYLASLAGKFV
ncbi:2-dehydro-3-deoxyphosphogluconate aldolase/(4S)-4-hydroxy-2-oxoglutarate aldolase [Amycolatopsis bartoniae]|uniref:2-dehydro-3-deoxy-phosphogluconate aldolase n=1 Tax=Amycolatopsis bartoniae TaxID=941986 RepID=A0A8H9M886_9PSEU|nr:bifunctional 4-hydroxy-2-oxoglutarate aldolase/2-dehydro-3-deoxy-phosphogluconate aldolase [Amycolatopsis bartoniae]MBB2936178.1 2-dehydro-3-deoxyphosphogluconate aldolase/(4S)-4-hydroxy-2-oxoglutarate aldolase [Amycolatopsis bartoniae]TVT07112.1 bifunctional 4-hydroxy-2-oxoglutarate aldolase/2-dehydro-3-deoxy-phosphogluconate aldolase [Amycolatopsis bartoniae]GHF81016.1 2-dehydro-3-deoxy-phosphogluconate aldolase [Amycolatopsis bartoniae]